MSSGKADAIDVLLTDKDLKAQKAAVEGLEELKLLLKYCDLYGISDKVRHGMHSFWLARSFPLFGVLLHVMAILLVTYKYAFLL